MNDEKTLKELIKKQTEIVENAMEHLNNLKEIAINKGINEDEFKPSVNINIKKEIENKRREILNRVEKIKRQAKEDMQNTIDKNKNKVLKSNTKIFNELPSLNKEDYPDDIKKIVINKEEKILKK